MEENKIPGAEIQENAGVVGGELGANFSKLKISYSKK